jgi:hypothetical protein
MTAKKTQWRTHLDLRSGVDVRHIRGDAGGARDVEQGQLGDEGVLYGGASKSCGGRGRSRNTVSTTLPKGDRSRTRAVGGGPSERGCVKPKEGKEKTTFFMGGRGDASDDATRFAEAT